MANDFSHRVLQIVSEEGPVSSPEIKLFLQADYNQRVDAREIHSLLYRMLHNGLVIRDKDVQGNPTWRAKGHDFEAAKGLEVLFFSELLKKKIVDKETSMLGYKLHDERHRKTYELDIAVFQPDIKLDIEIDGYEHMRADARLSMQRQIEERGENCEMHIDWMDNDSSYADFKTIEVRKVFKPRDLTRNFWLNENGWKVIRFWTFEVKDEMEKCIRQVKELIGK